MPVAQDTAAITRLAEIVRGHSVFELTALHDLVAFSGSLILGLAASRSYAPPEDIFSLSRLDEAFQTEQWGEDEEAAESEARKLADFVHAARFFQSAQKTVS